MVHLEELRAPIKAALLQIIQPGGGKGDQFWQNQIKEKQKSQDLRNIRNRKSLASRSFHEVKFYWWALKDPLNSCWISWAKHLSDHFYKKMIRILYSSRLSDLAKMGRNKISSSAIQNARMIQNLNPKVRPSR